MLQACSANLTSQSRELHTYLRGVSSEAKGPTAGASYMPYWVLWLSLGHIPNTVTTFHDYHGRIAFAMDHANLRCRHRPHEYHSSLLCLGPIYQTDINRADEAARNPYTYAQSACVAPYERQTPPRPGAKDTFTPTEAHNNGPVSQRRVSQPSRLFALDQFQ